MGGSFNLVDEPWILVMDRDGAVHEVSLRDAFRRAPALRQIVGEVPTQSFAILRLLLAILHRAVQGPSSVGEWLELRDDWEAACETVSRYLETFRGRFDLRHPDEPFFQVAGLRSASGEVSGLEKLIADVPNGAPYFTTRLGRGLERITWSEAARWLVHVHAFDPSGIKTGAVGDPRVKGGRGYPIGPAWVGQIGGVSLVGENLAETLLLNLIVPESAGVLSGPDDLPPWERPQLDQRADDSNGGEPRGFLDLYTWQARRVRLAGDDDGVTGVVIAQGDRATPHNRHVFEPMTAWRFSENQTRATGTETYMPRAHQAERQFWRGLEALLPSAVATSGTGPRAVLPPGVLSWAAELREAGLLEGFVRVRAVGVEYGPQSSTYAEILDDELVLPAAVVADGALAQVCVDAVRVADKAVGTFASLAKNIASASGGAPDDSGPGDRARERGFAALDPEFRRWLVGLGTAPEPRAHLAAWHGLVRATVGRLGAQVVANAGPAAWRGREVRGKHLDLGKAEVWFRAALRGATELAEQGAAQEVTA